MNPESFDHIFRSKLLHAESDVPDQLWTQIDAGLKSSKKTNRWLILLILPLALTGYLIGNVVSQQPETSIKTDISNQSAPDPEVGADIPDYALAVTDQTEEKSLDIVENTSLTPGSIIRSENGLEKSSFNAQSHEKSKAFSQIIPVPTPKPSIWHNKAVDNHPSPIRHISQSTIIETLDPGMLHVGSPKIDICPAFTVENGGLRPFLEFSLMAGLPIRTLNSSDSEWDGYRDLRTSTEKVRLSLDLQALVGLDIGRHFEIKTGIGLNQIRESFQYVDETASRTITSIITDTLRTGTGVIITRDTSIVTEHGQRTKRTNNVLTRLDIPIVGGFRFNVQNHRFTIGGGVAINLFFWQKGSILDPDGEIVSINSNSSDNNPIFVSRAGLDILTNLGYEIDLSALNSIKLSASYRWSLKNVTSPDYPLNQRYSQINLGLSLKHKL